MRITNALLDFRADHGRLLREAGYRPLRVRGSQAAYRRRVRAERRQNRV
jgi:hypothetical protein